MTTSRRCVALVAAALLASTTAACASSGAEAARSAYDACAGVSRVPGTTTQLVRVRGDSVYMELTEHTMRTFGLDQDGTPAPDSARDPGALIGAIQESAACLAEHTGYDGDHRDLAEGQEWDGWRAEEVTDPSAGVASVLVLTSTS